MAGRGYNSGDITLEAVLVDSVTPVVKQISRTLIKQKSLIDSFGKSIGSAIPAGFDKAKASMGGYVDLAKKVNSQIKASFAQGKTKGSSVFGEIFNTDIRKSELGTSLDSLPQMLPSKKIAASFKSIDSVIGKSSAGVGHMRGQLMGLGMSVMFFGMQMKRTFDQIWKSSTKVFQDVMHSIDGQATAFDTLQGSISYLGFVIGQAFEPVAEWLSPIIDAIATWVSENQELAAGLLIALGVLGSLMFFAGQLGLLIMGIVVAWPLITAAAGAMATGVAAIFAGLFSPIGALIAVFVAMWFTNFGNMQEFVSDTFGVIWETIKSVFKNVKGVFTGLWKVIKGIFTGDFEMLWEGVMQVVINVVAGIVKLIVGLGAAIWNVFLFVSNVVIDIFFNLAKFILGMIKSIIDGINKIPGINIGTKWAEDGIDTLSKWQSDAKWDYISGDDISKTLGIVDEATDRSMDWLTASNENEIAGGAPQQVINNITVEVDGEHLKSKVSEDIVTEVNRQ